MPKINEMLLKLGGNQYVTSLDLNMVCYHMQLSKKANSLCMNILPWKEYLYKRLAMLVVNSPDILQHKINGLFRGFEFIREYIDDRLVLTKVDLKIMYINIIN